MAGLSLWDGGSSIPLYDLQWWPMLIKKMISYVISSTVFLGFLYPQMYMNFGGWILFSKEKLTGAQTIACPPAKYISLVVEVCALPVHKICSVRTSNYATRVQYDILLCTSDNIVHICWAMQSSCRAMTIQRISFTIIALLHSSMLREYSKFKSETFE